MSLFDVLISALLCVEFMTRSISIHLFEIHIVQDGSFKENALKYIVICYHDVHI